MDEQTLMTMLDENFARRKRLLIKKKAWRVHEGDRLSQFKAMAVLRHTAPINTALDLASKQITQLYNMEDSAEPINISIWRDIIYDIQNYLDLALACLEEDS